MREQSLRRRLWVLTALLFLGPLALFAQIDPIHRNLIELGYDQPITGQGPQGLYAYYYYNNPEYIRTNLTLRLAVAPAYMYGELGFKQLISPYTDVGIGFYGGAFGDNYYEVRQGRFYKSESFDGFGGGAALSVYQLLDPGLPIPLSLVGRGGFRSSVFAGNRDTDDNFTVPENLTTGFFRTGLRFGGKEPVLYPDLGLEISGWYERQWRYGIAPYGFNGDEQLNAASSLYWAYAGLNYSWTNIGHQVSFAVTAGGSSDADRFSAWRLGGVLPLVSEFPLVLPGYYYEELSATRFVHFYGRYLLPLERSHRLQFMLEAAAARISYLPGFEQREAWQTGAGVGLSYTPRSKICRVVLRYGYGFNAIRNGKEGAQSVGLLFQYDFEARKSSRRGE
jgi:hypothetical protein